MNQKSSKQKGKKKVTTTTITTTAPVAPKGSKRRGRGGRRRSSRPSDKIGRSLESAGNMAKQYLLSLMYPENAKVRVPDVCSLPTSVVTATYDTTIVADAITGVGGLKVDLYAHAGTTSASPESAASVDTAFAYGGAVFLPAAASFNSAFIAARLVSASLQCEFVGNSLNDQGSIFVASIAGTLGFAETVPTTVITTLSSRDNARYPLRQGCYIRWKPTDDTCDDFHIVGGTNLKVGTFVVHISGALAGSTALRVKLTCNYEGIPSTDTFNFQDVEPSPVNPSAYEYARATLTNASSLSSWWDASKYVSEESAGNRFVTLGISGALYGATRWMANQQAGREFGLPDFAPAA